MLSSTGAAAGCLLGSCMLGTALAYCITDRGLEAGSCQFETQLDILSLETETSSTVQPML